MNVVHLSPHFPPNYHLFSVRLKERGIRVLGIGDCPVDLLSEDLQNALTDYYQVGSMEDYEQVLRACGFFVYRYGRLHGIESHNEHWLGVEAQIREDFNIPGLQPADMEMRSKSVMKKYFQDAGFTNTAKYALRKDLDLAGAKKFAKQVGYPIIAKPNQGVGAEGIFKIKTDKELETFFAKNCDNYILEEFISAPICTFDGLVDDEGKIVFCTSMKYCDNVMEIVHEGRQTMYYVDRDMPEDLMAAGEKIVKAFGIRKRFFHLEFFRLPKNGALVPLEVNLRPPGGLSMDMFNFAHDIDLYSMWASMFCGGKVSDYQRKYFCAYVSRRKNRLYWHSHKEVLFRYQDTIVFHSEIPHVFSTGLGDHGYLLRSKNLEKLFEVKEYIHKLGY